MSSLHLSIVSIFKFYHFIFLFFHMKSLLTNKFFYFFYEDLRWLKLVSQVYLFLNVLNLCHILIKVFVWSWGSENYSVSWAFSFYLSLDELTYLMLMSISEHLQIIPPYSRLKTCSSLLRSIKCIALSHPRPDTTSQQSSLCIFML
jgi:hypothetical protein